MVTIRVDIPTEELVVGMMNEWVGNGDAYLLQGG